MEQAIQYMEQMNIFITLLLKTEGNATVTKQDGRRFDRLFVNDQTKYFVERRTGNIFGAKSSFQYNPRRKYGTLATVSQFNWEKHVPITGSEIEKDWLAAEQAIVANYKKRGRPKKVK